MSVNVVLFVFQSKIDQNIIILSWYPVGLHFYSIKLIMGVYNY